MKKKSEKLKFLKGLMKGELSISDLLPPKYLVIYEDDDDSQVVRQNEINRGIAKNDPSVTKIRVFYE